MSSNWDWDWGLELGTGIGDWDWDWESMNFFRTDVVRTEAAAAVGGGTNRMRDFLSKSIKEKEADLEGPVCMETAEAPIFMC